jgi:hypothetical protein
VIRRARAILAAIAVAAATPGCSPDFSALNAPPPFTRAELCDGATSCGHDHHITLTKGIALAFECTAPQGSETPGAPCTGVRATLDDPAIATVLAGYLDTLSPGEYSAAQPRSALVVVGKEVGHTTLSIDSDQGARDFDVEIVDL